jgi:hypothetical protein
MRADIDWMRLVDSDVNSIQRWICRGRRAPGAVFLLRGYYPFKNHSTTNFPSVGVVADDSGRHGDFFLSCVILK